MVYRKNSRHFITLLAAIALLLTIPQASKAATYEKLIAKGYKIGTLTQNQARSLGWRLSNGKKQYFCRSKAILVYVGKTKMVNFLVYGQKMYVNRRRYEAEMGGYNKRLPQMRDFEAGRIKPYHVGRCTRIR